jgi:glycerol-3-phosphate dehydrogenase
VSWADEPFDAVVVGGGIYGILLALEGAARSQRVLLLERDDFGGATTFNHLRTIHGGLRYLQFLDIRRAVTSNRQRLWWLRTFPDLVHPISCLMPLYGQGLRRSGAFRGAFLLGRMLGLDRDGEGRAQPMRLASTAEVEGLLPLCRRDGLDRGALWPDAFMPRPHRIVAELLHWAEQAGAVVRNRVEFVAATRGSDRMWRADIRDGRSGAAFTVRAARLINAAGASVDEVARRMLGRPRQPILVPTLAWGLLIERPPVSECAVAVAPPGAGRRTYFLHPYHGRILAGTGHAGLECSSASPPHVADREIGETLADLNAALPALDVQPSEVRYVFRGILPGVKRGSEALLMHPRIVDHGRSDRAPDAWTVLGVKFTEAPFVARRFWDAVAGRIPRALPPRPAPLPAPTIEEARGMSDPELGERLHALAETEWHPGADDLAWRRTDLWMDADQAPRVARLTSGADLQRART